MAEHEDPPHDGGSGEPEHHEHERREHEHHEHHGHEHHEHKPHAYEIVVNMVAHKVERDVVTFDEIVKLAGNLPSGPNVEYKVSYENAVKPPHGTMIPGDRVQIKNGTEFVVTTTNRS